MGSSCFRNSQATGGREKGETFRPIVVWIALEGKDKSIESTGVVKKCNEGTRAPTRRSEPHLLIGVSKIVFSDLNPLADDFHLR